ncbi:hypothetical protein SteCoe_12891 [Stentor coeruleus]|uniref:Calreticulin n=1 Tax=Stentor coeruleus TaxID=5963 RepID=A0A1R2C9N5_9CILI|nr:hypothetical protein SteCoe_12891 [Stentor coeruleus]
MLFTFLISLVAGKVYFQETFNMNWNSGWVQSYSQRYGQFISSPGNWYADISDLGIKTLDFSTNYAISSSFPSFSTSTKPLIIQYTLKNENVIDCAGGYIKILSSDINQRKFSGKTPYLIMFGPDICNGEAKGHLIIPYKGENYSIKTPLRIINDQYTHQYTLVINPDDTFEYYLDNEFEISGKIRESFDMPEDYDDNAHIIENIGVVGIEVLQATPGSVFDNFIIGDDIGEIREFSKNTFVYRVGKEKKAKKKYDDQQEEVRRQAVGNEDLLKYL